jgi:apolipoprotein N-acyltransferase
VATTLTPDLFPWRLAGTQVSWVPWIQLAEVGGEPLLDLFVALVGCGAVECVRRRAPGAAVVAALALLVPLLYGAWRLPEARAERDRAPRLSVGVVQPNVGISEKHDPNLAMPHLRQLQDATVELEARGADLVVWPESAYPFPIRRRSVREAPGPARIRSRGVRGPVLFGTITVGDDRARYNSVVALGADGRYLGIADKIELLAFGEYVPLWEHLPPLQHYFPSRGLVPGESPRVLAIGGARVGVFNCYEDVLPEYGLRVGRLGPDLLVNATNDAWFGDTSEPWLHQSVARMRSVETRRDLVRAVNTGVSSHTASTGQDLHRTDTMVAAAFVAQARLLSGSTFWLRWGDLTTPLLAGALLGAAFALRRRDP